MFPGDYGRAICCESASGCANVVHPEREDAVKVFELSADAVGRMITVDLKTLEREPDSPIGHFEFHGCTCGVASFIGQPPWELHTIGDELLHVLAGETQLTILSDGAEDVRLLRQGDVAIVPEGCWHRNHAAGGVTLLFMTPRDGGDHSWDDPRGRP
jgi:mannose-6-phosphate isomerase-like protein (cupin superfamily)